MDTPLLELTALATGYGTGRRTRIVGQHLNARLRQGGLTVLAGRNGCGKSTLLRTLAGFVPPRGGRVTWQGRDLRTMTVHQLARTAAIVLTVPPDTGYQTARELVEAGRMPHTGPTGRMTARDREAVERAIRATGTEHLIHRRATTLSDGERQRVMTAKALAQETPAILMDEPTAFLDFPSKMAVMRLLKQLAHEENRGILLATHDLEPALQLADHVWLLTTTGIEEGTPRELADSGRMERFFANDGIRFDRHDLRFRTETHERPAPVDATAEPTPSPTSPTTL